MRPILLGVLASFFFASTFVLNRAMELTGGSWFWSSSLRYFFMVPFLFIIVLWRRNLKELWIEMRSNPKQWFLWSTIGFGLFYAPLTFAAAYGPGWLIAGTWQITIISGSLLVPFFYETVNTENGPIKVKGKIPFKGLAMSMIILVGIMLMQIENMSTVSLHEFLLSIIPVLVATFAYPLGNRKMMEVCQGRLDVFQRVLGMTIASLPFWVIIAAIGLYSHGLPSLSQTGQSLTVAISSGVIATVLFFMATDMVKNNMKQMAAVEATQSVAIVFTLIGEILVLKVDLPNITSLIGISLVVIGMILHSYVSRSRSKPKLTVISNKGLSS